MGLGGARGLVLVVLLSLLPRLAAADASLSPFRRCERALDSQPMSSSAAECFFETARDKGRWEEATVRLEARLQKGSKNPWLELALGQIFVTTDRSRSIGVLRSAVHKLASQDNLEGEQLGRIALYRAFKRTGQLDAAQGELQRVIEIGSTPGRPLFKARAQIEEAHQLKDDNKELGRAIRLVTAARQTADQKDAYGLQVECLTLLGNLNFALDRRRAAMVYYRALSELAARHRDQFIESFALYLRLFALKADLRSQPTARGRRQAIELAHEVLRAAHEAKNSDIERLAHLDLGRLLGGEEGKHHFEECLSLARRSRAPARQSECLRNFAAYSLTDNPPAMEDALEAANKLALETGKPWEITSVQVDGAIARIKAGLTERGFAEIPSALHAVELLRDIQLSSSDRAGMFSRWSAVYYVMSGSLLRSYEDGNRRRLGEAFGVIERMRSRQLLAALDSATLVADGSDVQELRKQRKGILAQIAQSQRRLLNSHLTDADRKEAMADLERMESQEDETRDRLAELEPRQSAVEHQEIASLAAVSARLEPDQALLSFQLAGWKDIYDDFDGGSWLLVVTRSGTRVYRLPEPAQIAAAVRIFRGLLDRRDGTETAASVGLYEMLLRDALADLPATVTKLVVIPDGPLHHLPLGALRPRAGAPPLVTRYAISRAPSATLWLRWRREKPRPQGTDLILAAPPTPDSDPGPAAVTRQWALARDARLGSLPWALAEGRAAKRYLGSEAVLRTGPDANERFLKTADLTGVSLLHFAAHAIDDEDRPERAGIVLSPGARDEDGLLQMHEIVELPLTGTTVILSACSTASGTVLRGEGVMSLARGFFEAGAHSVVGSLWPLRDDDGETLFTAFYRHLAHGTSVGSALQAAQLDRLRAGDDTVAWSGVVVLGDAEVRPVPPRPWLGPLQIALGLALVALVALVAAAVWSFVRWRRAASLLC